MIHKKLFMGQLAAVVVIHCITPALAEELHNTLAQEHAKEAATAKDSVSIGHHAEQALKHTEEAKEQAAGQPETLQHLEKSEKALNASVKNSKWFNTNSAAVEAAEARKHLEAAGR